MGRMSRVSGRLLFGLALLSSGASGRPQALAGEPWADYFPKVTLQTQDNKEVRFYEDLIKGKIVVINFMYTRCDGKLCDQGTKNLVHVQKALGDRLGREVFMYSITLDPEHDTPAVLKDYAKRYEVKPGWTFLTGKAKDIENLRRKLGLFNSDPIVDADRKQHTGMMRLGNAAFNKWSMTSVLSNPERIMQMIERMKPPTPSPK
jgi:protein SCO1